MRKNLIAGFITLSLLFISPAWAEDQPTVVDIKRMSLDVALRIAKATIDQCRKEGVQVAVTVVDRGGHPQVVLRDVLAQDLTLRISKMKAYTAMSFNMATSEMEDRFTQPFSIGKVEGLVMSAGGVPIQASGNIIGGVGVSGAPSGEIDEKCAKAGVDAVQVDLEMATM
ncbi:MAG: heme-binding protein [Gammaproteobacteria bacterium]|jgi:uncharacterized protein GlcG (DUF336 family)